MLNVTQVINTYLIKICYLELLMPSTCYDGCLWHAYKRSKGDSSSRLFLIVSIGVNFCGNISLNSYQTVVSFHGNIPNAIKMKKIILQIKFAHYR